DMQKPFPMNRLLQGEVGSGKTVVAAIAALNAARNGWQIALMAPTEVLALQHFSVFAQFFALFGCDVGLLTGAQAIVHDGELRADRKMKKQDVIQMIAQGALPVVVGTHALISKNCVFRKLGLVVLDEQHRFGVKQRAALVKTSRVGAAPHLLSMTATPIPRTLALTLYGDLDISLLDEIPKERKKVITKIVLPAHRQAAYAFIRKQAKEGRQIFVICPRIEVGSELSPATVRQFLSAEVKTVKEEYRKLSAEMFPDLRVVMLHGKMKAKEKEETMKKFKNGGADILVSTSVVEVGIDVPNATVMMVEGAELFGLAQLHQFRGRVGRGEHQSYCLLFSGNPRTQKAEQSSYDDNPRTQRAEQSSYDGSAAPEENRRLKALLESHSGFALAEKDLALRGPGDFLGTRQWGLPDLAMASLADAALVKETRDEALRIMKEDPSLEGHPLLKRYLRERAAKVHPE
ncbi:DEAD/DEAH box helicase, partial [Candidatus Azambacteria bacterium]|nr:DEAD/DEAH box helicase [Candidatus Azambacteria bacterium]